MLNAKQNAEKQLVQLVQLVHKIQTNQNLQNSVHEIRIKKKSAKQCEN